MNTKPFGVALVLACVAASGTLSAVEEARKAPPALGYACVPSPKKGPVNVVMTPPPAGFKCPPGETLFLVTKQLQDQVAGAPATEVPIQGPAGPPELSSPPGTHEQEVRAPKRKTKKKQCTPTYGGMYCCYGGYSDCRIE